MICPVGTPRDAVAIEYDKRGKRAAKQFTDHYAARRFYVMQFKAGNNPKVRKVV